MVQPKRIIIACLLALALIFGAAGCSAAAAESQTKSNVKASASIQPTVSDNQKIADYLKAARSDLGLVDEIMADQDLGLLNDSESDEDLTPEFITKYETILTGYTDRITTVLGDIDKRTIPGQPDIVKFKTAEKAAFQTLDSILQEYNQTLAFAGTYLTVSSDLDELKNLNETDLQKIYDTISTKLKDAIKLLEETDVPTFLESANKDFINALQQLDDAVYYALSAAANDDPLRTDAADYLMGILQRHTDKIGQELVQDLTDRQKKLQSDAAAVQKTCDGLKNWLDTNIANMGV